MDFAQASLKRRLPPQDQGRLSYCVATPRKVEEWVSALPMVNVGESSRLVYQTVQEVNRLQTDERSRFGMLEALRPAIYFLCNALAKHYLNQPVVLPEKASKVATLAQAMQNHLASGYKLVTLSLIEKLSKPKRDSEDLRIFTSALHRAISDITSTLLRCSQLYLATPAHLWQELHALYLLADQFGLRQQKIKDPTHRFVDTTSIEEAYIRALLLSTCRPNQLRQSDIALVYQTSELWTGMIQLKSVGAESDIFVFNLALDAPPTYRTLARGGDVRFMRAIGPEAVVAHLQDLLSAQISGNRPDGGEGALSADLLRHLIHSWGALSERSFDRTDHQGQLQLCIGLTATHYYCAGNQDFEVLLQGGRNATFADQDGLSFGSSRDPFKARPSGVGGGDDPWATAFDAGTSRMAQFGAELGNIEFRLGGHIEGDGRPKYSSYHCEIVNVSPGGYCIAWKGEVPSPVRTGEILGLREGSNDNWSIAVIRWIKQIPGQGAQLGLEVLAPKTRPCGARVLKKTGEHSEYMRALLLPEMRSIGRPATLITPNLTFRTGYKIHLNLDGEEIKAQLIRQVGSTPSFSQFEFHLSRKPDGLDQTDDNGPGNDEVEDDFDSIWSSL